MWYWNREKNGFFAYLFASTALTLNKGISLLTFSSYCCIFRLGWNNISTFGNAAISLSNYYLSELTSRLLKFLFECPMSGKNFFHKSPSPGQNLENLFLFSSWYFSIAIINTDLYDFHAFFC